LKIFGYRHQFTMSKHKMDSLHRICLFTCTIYASFWFAAHLPTTAPMNDLMMMQLTEDFAEVDKKISDIA